MLSMEELRRRLTYTWWFFGVHSVSPTSHLRTASERSSFFGTQTGKARAEQLPALRRFWNAWLSVAMWSKRHQKASVGEEIRTFFAKSANSSADSVRVLQTILFRLFATPRHACESHVSLSWKRARQQAPGFQPHQLLSSLLGRQKWWVCL